MDEDFTARLSCFSDVLEGVVPVLEQICGVFVIHANVVVVEQTGEEVVDLSGYVEDVTDTGLKELK